MGTVSTKLHKSTHCGKLDFGNCWDAGVVKAYFDDKLIGEAQPNTQNKVVEFPILKDGELKIRDEGANSVIKFTKFELVDCTSEPQSKNYAFILLLSSNKLLFISMVLFPSHICYFWSQCINFM